MSESKKLSDREIIDYLKSNPKFLIKNPDVVDYLIPPKDNSNGRGVVDFTHYMVEKLKTDKKMVLDTTRDIIEVSRENMNNLARIHEAVLKLLEAQSFEEFMQILTTDVPVTLDCDMVSMVIEDSQGKVPSGFQQSIRLVSKDFIDQWMQGNDVRIQSNIRGSEDIFGAGAGLVRSQALLKINQTIDIPPTLIAFGSRDPEMFRDGQGADLIAFLCKTVERMLKLWLSR
jgi:hypothetical protein